MGMSIRAKLIYGVGYDELSELEGLDDMLDDGELDYASPYYDADRDEWIVGIELPVEHAGEAELMQAVRDAKARFEELGGGVPGRIIACPHVS